VAEKLRVDRIADLGNAMSSPLQSPKTIELHGIERVLPENRFDQNLWNNFTLWLSANFVIPTLALGTLAQAVFKLGTRESLLVILVFNLIAAFPAAIELLFLWEWDFSELFLAVHNHFSSAPPQNF